MKTIYKILIIIVLVISFISYGIYWAFFDIQHIKGQEFICESTSPNEKYTISAYLNNGGTTTAYAVLCKLKNNSTGKKKNIYWQYRCEDAEITWKSDEIATINGIELDVTKDVYDYRKK